MKNIILQHWDSENVPDWAIVASNTMRDYAAKCGAEYRLLHGLPFFDMLPEGLCAKPWLFEKNVQKLALLAEEFDEYDQVCMYDMDMCATPWAKNVFDDPGNLNIWQVPEPSMANNYSHRWMLTGAVYKFTRQQRQALREVLLKLDFNDQATFCGSQPVETQVLWYDEHVFAVVLNHPESSLDPASIIPIGVEFEAVRGQRAGWGRGRRPSRNQDISVRHFLFHHKHLIIPVVHKWYGSESLVKPARSLDFAVDWLRFFKGSLRALWNERLLPGAKHWTGRCLLPLISLPFELSAEI